MKIKTFVKAAVAGAAVFFLAGLAQAQLAEIPFYAGNQIKPNVMIMLDTSGSMDWDINGNSRGSRNFLGSTRMDIAKYVLTGSGAIPVQTVGYNVYMGDPVGDLSVRDYMPNTFTQVVRIDAATDQPDANGANIVFADYEDINRGNYSSAITTLDQYLWQMHKFHLLDLGAQDIPDGVQDNPRVVYTADDSGGTTARDAFVQHYWDVDRTRRIFPVIYVASCYRSGFTWYSCYKPDPAGDYFVFFDNTDYNVSASDPEALLWSYDLFLGDYLYSKGTDSYKSSDQGNRTVCGDSTGQCSSSSANDGRSGSRTVYMWVAHGASGATVAKNRAPTEAEVKTALVGGIPMVTLTDVLKPYVDGKYGPDFIFKTPGDHSLDYAVRGCHTTCLGLSIPQPSTPDTMDSDTDPLNYLNSAFTYVKDGVTYHFFDGKDADHNGAFDGLTYSQQYEEKDPGLLDIYTNIRWGLAKFDNSSTGGSDSDFTGCGANLLVSLPDEYSDGISADTARKKVQDQIIGMSVGNYTPLADSMRNMYEYFFAPDILITPGGHNTNPSMYVDHDCDGAKDDHIVQADAAYTSMTEDDHLGCRRNFVIFVTDGDQTMGLGCTGTCTTSIDCCDMKVMQDHQQYWVTQLKNGGDIWQGVKVFLIGFALQGNQLAINQLEGMADASKMGPPDDPYDYAFYANDEEQLKTTLATIFNVIMAGSYTRSAPVVNAKETVTVGGYFTVNPDKVMWQGHLELYDLTQAATLEALGGLTPEADGALVLNEMSSSDRDIFTALPEDGADNWAFHWDEEAETLDLVEWDKLDFVTGQASTLLDILLPEPEDQDGDTALNEVHDAEVLISFIRGTPKDSPQVTFKNKEERDWTLGAINRSVPVIVGPPAGQPAESFRKYEYFLDKYKARPNLVYVGANDGMLHAFFLEDLNGNLAPAQMEEAFAYIPHEVLDKLRYLRENQWYYVDGSPKVADVFLPQPVWMSGVAWDDTAKRAAAGCDEVGDEHFCWRTMLVCGLGQGGQSYFALDVTDADSTSASTTTTTAENINVFWEFNDPGHLGDTWSTPFLAELRLGDGDSTWVAAAFGGGQSAAGDHDVGNYIYFVNADDASIIRRFMVPDKDDPNWINKVDHGLWNDDPARTSSGDTLKYFESHNYLPSDPSVVDTPPQEGLSELLYMGDLQGRLWKVNVASGDTAEWEMGLLWDTGDTLGNFDDETDLPEPPLGSGYAVFDARRRPIFYAPTVVEAPGGGRLVIFGTGHIEDKTTARDETMVNCIFSVWDRDPITTDSATVDLTSYGTLWTEEQREEGHCAGCVGEIDYPFCFEPGEKIISKPTVDEGLLKFQTFIPFSESPCKGTYNPCKPGVVRNWYVDYLTFEGILNLPGEGGRYIENTKFTTSRFTLTNKFGDIYMTPPQGLTGNPPPANKTTDILSWAEGISFDW